MRCGKIAEIPTLAAASVGPPKTVSQAKPRPRAVRLSKVFGGSAESWRTQQAQYNLEQVRADRTNNSQQDIEENSFSCLVGDFAADETCHQTQHDPGQA
ncbi:MAG TPA: hypothetical protein VHF01_15515 [Candidatus Acidoferrum sp.]|nr:hypothetical protein [Candidatus Acidoferrum sp.]